VSDLPTPVYELSPICPEKSDGQFYKKPIKINELVGPAGLNGAAQACDLPIMRRGERAELG